MGGCVFGSSPKRLQQLHPQLVHWWLLIHSSPELTPLEGCHAHLACPQRGFPLALNWPKWTSTPYARFETRQALNLDTLPFWVPEGSIWTPLTGFVWEWAWPLPKKGHGSWCFLALNNTCAKKPLTSNTKMICVLIWWADFVALIEHCYDFWNLG
jgi:hypothetical protein